jgi:hypothetical protein
MPEGGAVVSDTVVLLPVCPDCHAPLTWPRDAEAMPNMRTGAVWWCPVCEEFCEVTG